MSGITHKLSAARLNKLFLAGELSAVEIAESALNHIAQVEPAVGAFIHVAREHVLERAKKLDARRKAGDAELGPLAGVPVAVKDNICTCGMETTCASRILKGYVSPYDATVVERLRAAGAIDHRQDEHGRVRHGLLQRDVRVRRHPQPVGPGARARRLVRRLGRGRGGRGGPARAGHRHRRLHPAAGRLLPASSV